MIHYRDMNLVKKLFYNFLYLTNPPWDTGVTPPELVSFVDSRPPGRALDLGCGTGTNVIYMAQHGWNVTGVDFIRRAIRKARRKATKAGVEADFRVDDVVRLRNIHGPFHLILDIGCFHNLQDHEKKRYLRNIDQLLSPDGTFLIYTFIKNDPSQKTGISDRDIEAMQSILHLTSRQDGTDRGVRTSAWLRFDR